ncbi:MAG: Glucose-6-phosphate 1-dehydrogenase 2 [Chlamydiia bacterium]|nr:Glucose-6-phosphate 1-dehydrogenase 2 [Chlamydiia bacterium]
MKSEDPNYSNLKGQTVDLPEDLFAQKGKEKTPPPCILVIFGASGDLTKKKLIPALYNLMNDGLLPANFVCVGFARRGKSAEDFRKEMSENIKEYSRSKTEEKELEMFTEKLFYFQSNFDDDQGYENLTPFLEDLDKKFGTNGNRIYYLSVQPSYFSVISDKLKAHNHIYDENDKEKFSRVIIEKPFGHDLASAQNLQKDMTQNLSENQIYRIDHYLGKETVQNLLVFRFGNSIYEGLWNNRYVDNIQITVGESIGIESRGAFYESAGLCRDIIQNHLMQVLSLVTMEPPTSLDANSIRDEKVKLLSAIRHYRDDEIEKYALRGQYKEGFVDGETAKAYRQEENVNPESNVETFAAMRLSIDNWRWAGVPIYIRAGKRLPKRATEVCVTFKRPPNILFNKNETFNSPNCFIFRIQPNEGISIRFNSKVPGTANLIQPVTMDFQYESFFGKGVPEAYERLIHDCIMGDNTLFARVDESLHSWEFISPILDRWKEKPFTEEEFYSAGTWGPINSELLLREEKRSWKML